MFSCVVAAAGFLGGWLLVLVWHLQGGTGPSLPANGLAYAGLAIYAMALAGRCAAKWHPALKRVTVLIACAVLAGIDVGLAGLAGVTAQKTFFAALLGVALVVLIARHAPAAVRDKWLGS